MSTDLTPDQLLEIATVRDESAETVALRVRDMLRRCRILEGLSAEELEGTGLDYYTTDVRYLVGAIQTLVADRAHALNANAELLEAMTQSLSDARSDLQNARGHLEDARRDTASAVDEAAEYLRELRRVEDDVVQLTADLERARRG